MRKSDYFASQISTIRGLPEGQLVWKMPEVILVLFHVLLAIGDGLGIQRGQSLTQLPGGRGWSLLPGHCLLGDNRDAFVCPL